MLDATWLDAHCHIDLLPDPRKVIVQIEQNRIATIAVTNTPSVFPHMERFAAASSYVKPALGLHPQLAVQRQRELPQMWELFHRTRYIGEIGLDYQTRIENERKGQRDIFDRILTHCAEYGDKILTIHSRRAAKDVISAIGDNFKGKIILHWYSGGKRDLSRAISYGFYFSVNGAMLASQSGKSLVSQIPFDRLLTETDAPFTKSQNRKTTPLLIPQVTQELADFLARPIDELAAQVHSNFQRLHEQAQV